MRVFLQQIGNEQRSFNYMNCAQTNRPQCTYWRGTQPLASDITI